MKNELEMAVLAGQKALQKLIDDNPKSGVIVDRGMPSEAKIRNVEAIKALERVLYYFTDKGARNWGICKECDNYDTEGVSSASEAFGRCGIGRGIVHCYDTCPKHTGRDSE